MASSVELPVVVAATRVVGTQAELEVSARPEA
jgi:hypothetical protein